MATIGLARSEHTSSHLFYEFCDNLTRLAPKIKISKVDADPQDPPQILIGRSLRYQAVPVGYELPPFLEALAAHESGFLNLTDTIKILVFGETGDTRSMSWLESVLAGDFDREVKEAAEEALSKITNTDT